jgi:hypothetical protein
VVEVFAFEIDFGSDPFGDIGSVVECGGSADIVFVVVVHLRPEILVKAYSLIV